MNAWLLLVVVVAVAAAAWEYYLVYLDSPGHHRRVTAAQAARRRAAARVRVHHQPIPRQLLIADNCTVEAAAERAPRDRDALIAGLGQIGQPAR